MSYFIMSIMDVTLHRKFCKLSLRVKSEAQLVKTTNLAPLTHCGEF